MWTPCTLLSSSCSLLRSALHAGTLAFSVYGFQECDLLGYQLGGQSEECQGAPSGSARRGKMDARPLHLYSLVLLRAIADHISLALEILSRRAVDVEYIRFDLGAVLVS